MTNDVEKDVVCSTGDVEGDVRWGVTGVVEGDVCVEQTEGEKKHMCV